MKSTTLLLTTVLALSICSVKSQFPGQMQSPEKILRQIKATNDALIDRQEATIKTIEGMQDLSRQIKIYSKRA